ncbi:hypothetical protein IQ37_00435 [Chryseobacterium piperi]|uniref:Uncharacterized protein n=1 Tax=Chryseobacterium piperi TaxID=558152 RepID=A0A086BMW9_9FLAO|nr:hypothetical protein [Chryseobacterium piperi]ASW75079.1 hypothetical protein CJF12_12840 [Chryseobacterium piperi]KFF30283.1 hypothetical protein IQ37_00435 [Chryseobacterium piperi]
MKQLFYFILLFAGFSSIHSCKDLIDEDGNPLIDLNNNTGLIGPRALYREITDADTIAEYHYNGLLLSRVLTDSASITDVMYSGDKVSKIDFRGFLDLDNNGKLDKDSISYSQIFTYGVSGRLEKISENRSIYRRPDPVPPATTPGPQTLLKKTKTLYNLKYAAATSKLDSILMETGDDIPGAFAYTEYSNTGYTYLGDNVARVVRHYGPMTNNVHGAPTEKLGYDYTNFDSQISAYSLLPFAYKVSMILSTKYNDRRSLTLSPNSPKRMAITDLTTPIPMPAIFSTDYHYDPQTYVTKGFGINYIYKPL